MRRVFWLALIALSLAVMPLLAAGIPRDEFKERRVKLQKSLDGVMVLFGADEPEDLHHGFFQETNFLYLSGWNEPGAVMLLTKTDDILLVPVRNLRTENYTGRKLGPEDPDAPQRTGFTKVLPRYALEGTFFRLLESSPRVYVLATEAHAAKLKQMAPFHEFAGAELPIARLRMLKSPAEIELITQSSDATDAAHLAAWKSMKVGIYEYQIAATMTNMYFQHGCERSSYTPIVGSGPNSTVLHYSANNRRMDAGEIVVMDVGSECSGYATDVARTVPVNGKFSAREPEIY